MKRVLVISPFGIGDVLFTMPVIRSIKEAWPESFIGYWCNTRVSPLLEGNRSIDRVFGLARGDIKKLFRESFFKGMQAAIKLVWEIKKERFDICLDFSLEYRYSLFAKFAGIGRRVGFNYKGRGRFLTDKIDVDGYSGKHAVECAKELLKFLEIPPCAGGFRLDVSAEVESKAGAMLRAAGINPGDLLIGIAPGAGGSWGKDAAYKHWPAVKFAEVAGRLMEKLKAKVVILGDEQERKIAEVILHTMRSKPVDFTGRVKLEVLPGIIKRCSLFISNDGGPLHMAVALGVKTVSVFGPVSEIVYGPYPSGDPNHEVVKHDMPCRPCYNRFRLPACDRDKECLKAIGADEVFAAAERMLR
ncbi:MAG: glycosyltransferase family 9 protein [Candidatus Omnitrophota bacterium]